MCPWHTPRYRIPERDGSSDISGLIADDVENLARQFEVYDALYAWCRLQVAKGD